jgi:hypothetical protein
MTAESPRVVVRYGRINRDMMARWLQMDADEGGPFWALNLMKYRQVADYGSAGGPAVSGREADDAYTPRESLAAIGAEIAFAGDVERIPDGDGTGWDRIGIVRCRRRAKEVAPNVSKALYSSSAALLDAGVVSWEGVAG